MGAEGMCLAGQVSVYSLPPHLLLLSPPLLHFLGSHAAQAIAEGDLEILMLFSPPEV